MTKLSLTDVRAIADRVLNDVLGASGFTHADVRSGPDHYDEDSLFVTAYFRMGSDVVRGSVAGDAMVQLRHTLESEGDARFPYLSFDHPDDDVPNENEVESALA